MTTNLLIGLASVLGLNISFFVIAYAFKTDKFTDFTYGLSFIFLVGLFLFTNNTFFVYQLLAFIMVTLWAIRLITYLVIRIHKIKKDDRFDDIRNDPLKFFQFWFFQGLAAWVIMLPSMFVLSQRQDESINLLMIAGMLIWLMGLLIETVADWQKFTFKNDPKNKGKWIESGLWKYSRHPNYFGEMTLWWGIFIFAMPFLQGLNWLVILGPLAITVILLFGTGIPPLEKKYQQKYKNNKEYQAYRAKTSVLIPLPNKPN